MINSREGISIIKHVFFVGREGVFFPSHTGLRDKFKKKTRTRLWYQLKCRRTKIHFLFALSVSNKLSFFLCGRTSFWEMLASSFHCGQECLYFFTVYGIKIVLFCIRFFPILLHRLFYNHTFPFLCPVLVAGCVSQAAILSSLYRSLLPVTSPPSLLCFLTGRNNQVTFFMCG